MPFYILYVSEGLIRALDRERDFYVYVVGQFINISKRLEH
jgi:hypothetical protein